MAFIDVDGLKQVNDTGGHEAGDELLRRVASLLAEACAGGEYAYRFGGDEYAFLSTVRASPDIEVLMAGLSSAEAPFSWGVAHHPGDDQPLEEVIKIADQRMYERKRARKTVSVRFSLRGAAERLWRCLRAR